MDEMLTSFYHDNQKQIGAKLSQREALQATLALIKTEDRPEDSDDDHFEFAEAKVEEAEDILVDQYQRKRDALSTEEIRRITH